MYFFLMIKRRWIRHDGSRARGTQRSNAAGEPYRLTTDAATGSRALLLLAPCGQLFELSEAPLPAPHDSAAAARDPAVPRRAPRLLKQMRGGE